MLNANRSDRTSQVADEIVETDALLAENEGKIVIVSGTPYLENDGILVDEEAGLQVENAVFYRRAPYQLVYVKKQEEVVIDKGKDKISEVDDKKEIRTYVEGNWIIPSEKRDAVIRDMLKKYENPPEIDMSSYNKGNDIIIGEFLVSPADIGDYIQTKDNYFTKEELEQNCKNYIQNIKEDIGIDLNVTTNEEHGMLSNGNSESWNIGDVKVLFSYSTLESVEPVITVVGRQIGNKLVIDEEDESIQGEYAFAGKVSKDEYLRSITGEDAQSRTFGFVGLIIGLIGMLLSLNIKELISKK